MVHYTYYKHTEHHDMKIKKITKRPTSGRFFDITTAKNHNFFANGQLVHNCNTSAQNVIIVGNHRGLTPIDELDIIQAAGRAGRFGKAPEGHVYFICDSIADWERKVNNPRNVESTLLDEDTFSFHMCAEIRNKVIIDLDTLHSWYNRTLCSIQRKMEPSFVEGVVNKLAMWDAVTMSDAGQLACTALGVVSATLYYHPKDVFHWACCLSMIDQNDLWENNHAIAYMLSAPTVRLPYVTRRDELRVYDAQQTLAQVWSTRIIGSTLFADLVDLLNGEKPSIAARAIQHDIDRIAGALTWISGIKRISDVQSVKMIVPRIKYGVSAELALLCLIPGIGAARAQKLHNAGLTTPYGVSRNLDIVTDLFGSRVAGHIVEDAIRMLSTRT